MIKLIPENVIITVSNPGLMAVAQKISKKLTIPIVNESDNLTDKIVILINEHGVSLKTSNSKERPVHIDFFSPQINHRRANCSIRKEAIARAAGLKSDKEISIIDTTAGLGGDSFILACLGAKVTMLERNPLVHLLLEDALKRARMIPELADIIARMNLLEGNAIEMLATLPAADVIYLDPMFPQKSKTALNKKEMRLFRNISGDDADIDILFSKALEFAKKRIVVKRPLYAEELGRKPTFTIAGKACRFEVFECNVT